MRNFLIFSNITLIVLKNTLRCPLLYMELQTKKFISFGSPAKKIVKLVMAADATLNHMRKTQTIYTNFFLPKIFKLSAYNLLIDF
jgi:hypothetical protein